MCPTFSRKRVEDEYSLNLTKNINNMNDVQDIHTVATFQLPNYFCNVLITFKSKDYLIHDWLL